MLTRDQRVEAARFIRHSSSMHMDELYAELGAKPFPHLRKLIKAELKRRDYRMPANGGRKL